MLHGKTAALNAEKTAKETFIDGIVGKDLPVINLKKKQGNKINILELVLASKLLMSKGEVRRAIKNNGIKINDTTILDDKLIIDFNQYDKNTCKLSFGKKKHIVVKLILFLIFSKVRVINLGVKVLIGFTVVFKFFGGPLILKLTPNTPSPIFFPTKISPRRGIDDIVRFIVVAGTKVPRKLTNLFFSI